MATLCSIFEILTPVVIHPKYTAYYHSFSHEISDNKFFDYTANQNLLKKVKFLKYGKATVPKVFL